MGMVQSCGFMAFCSTGISYCINTDTLFRSMPEHASAQASQKRNSHFKALHIRALKLAIFSFASDGGLCSVTNLRSEK